MCHYKTAYRQFLETRQEHHTKGTVLARHLIQSFYPGEVDMETAHQIGQELCQKIFQGQYEYVLTTMPLLKVPIVLSKWNLSTRKLSRR